MRDVAARLDALADSVGVPIDPPETRGRLGSWDRGSLQLER